MDREAAPAGADLEHVVARAAGRACGRSGRAWRSAPRAARRPASLEDRAGVHHRLVEHQAEEVVAEVVVRGDAAGAPAPGCCARTSASRPAGTRDQRAHRAPPAVERRHVQRGQARELGQVVAVEPVLDVGVADAERSAQQRAVEAPVVDGDAHRGAVWRRRAEGRPRHGPRSSACRGGCCAGGRGRALGRRLLRRARGSPPRAPPAAFRRARSCPRVRLPALAGSVRTPVLSRDWHGAHSTFCVGSMRTSTGVLARRPRMLACVRARRPARRSGCGK